MGEQLQALLGRYSVGVKHIGYPGPNDSQIHDMACAALRAPDHAELVPFRLCVVRGDSRQRLADLFEKYAREKGKDSKSQLIERERALNAPVCIAVIARIDLHHPLVPAHEQWVCVGGCITNLLNAAHMMGFAGKMLSGEKVRDKAIGAAFCNHGETLVGWISVGTAKADLSTRNTKNVNNILTFF